MHLQRARRDVAAFADGAAENAEIGLEVGGQRSRKLDAGLGQDFADKRQHQVGFSLPDRRRRGARRR